MVLRPVASVTLVVNTNSVRQTSRYQIGISGVDSRNALSKFHWLFVCMLQFEKDCSYISNICKLKILQKFDKTDDLK